MATAKKEVTEFKPTTVADKKALALVTVFEEEITELAKQLTWTDEKLDEMLAHVDEQEVVKGAKTKCTNMRTAIANAHKEAKKPYLEMGKLIDGVKNNCTDMVKVIEAPLDAAIARRKQKQEEEAKAEQARKDAEQNTELNRLREMLIANGIDPDAADTKPADFIADEAELSISSASQIAAVKKLLGAKLFRSLVVDEHGTAYNLSVIVKRSEIDFGDEEEEEGED